MGKGMVSETGHRRLTPGDSEAAAQVISQAFIDDPLCAFMFSRRAARLSTLLKFFRPYCQLNIAGGRGFGVGDPLHGVAFWEFPTNEGLSVSVKSLGMFIPLLFSRYPLGYLRARPVIRQTDALHQKYAAGPHFYLDNIGVLPAARGTGAASKLIRPVLQLADEQKVIIYTDTVTPGNLTLYEHFGFECVERLAVPGTGITVFALRREFVQP